MPVAAAPEGSEDQGPHGSNTQQQDMAESVFIMTVSYIPIIIIVVSIFIILSVSVIIMTVSNILITILASTVIFILSLLIIFLIVSNKSHCYHYHQYYQDHKSIVLITIMSHPVKTCGPPRIEADVMSNLTVKPGQKVVFNCKVT